MVPVYWDEISTRPTRADSPYDYMGESNLISAKRDSFLPGTCLDFFTFSFNFPL